MAPLTSPVSAVSFRSSWIESLPAGHAGTLRTLQVMADLARRDYKTPFVQDTVGVLLSQVPGLPSSISSKQSSGPQHAIVEALFVFARDGIKFREDQGANGEQGVERVADFEQTTRLGWGDCDDKVTWLATGLLSRNISARFRVQSYLSNFQSEGWDHVYLEYFDWSLWSWVALDPTADGHTGIVAGVGWRQLLPASGSEMIYPI